MLSLRAAEKGDNLLVVNAFLWRTPALAKVHEGKVAGVKEESLAMAKTRTHNSSFHKVLVKGRQISYQISKQSWERTQARRAGTTLT